MLHRFCQSFAQLGHCSRLKCTSPTIGRCLTFFIVKGRNILLLRPPWSPNVAPCCCCSLKCLFYCWIKFWASLWRRCYYNWSCRVLSRCVYQRKRFPCRRLMMAATLTERCFLYSPIDSLIILMTPFWPPWPMLLFSRVKLLIRFRTDCMCSAMSSSSC